MKSTLLITALLTGLSNLGLAAVSLTMSSTTNYATNFLSKTTGDASSKMAWGIVVDTDGTGFKGLDPATPYYPDFNIAGGTNPLTLSVTTDGTTKIGTTNKLYISTLLMNLTTNTTDAGAVGLNRITNLNNLVYQDGVNEGDAFMVIWFDVTALGAPAQQVGYGMADVPGAAFRKLPADPGGYPYAAGWAGADAPKAMNMQLGVPVPEASTALLGVLGAIGLLRRRR